MSIESTIDLQVNTYEQLHLQHETIRREHQQSLVESIQSLNNDVHTALRDDKRTYERAKANFRQEYHLFRRLFTRAATKHKNYAIEPRRAVYFRRRDLAARVTQLLNETRNETDSIEMRTQWNGAIAVVYDPVRGRAEWRQCKHGGIHGVYNPLTRAIEWESEPHTGVYGVFNPRLNIVEWKRILDGGVHGVYNPSTGAVEWHVSFDSGVGGVFNPVSEQVEWKTSLKSGVVGYFDRDTETVKWMERWHHGLALIVWDPTAQTYVTSASCGWYGDK